MSIFLNSFKLFLLILTFASCNKADKNDQIGNLELNEALQNTIDSMAAIDQLPFKLITTSANPNRDSILELQTNIFINNSILAQKILSEFGYPGFDLVGQQSSKNYWLIVQHCDSFPNFQREVLDEMKKHVELIMQVDETTLT